RVVAAAERIAHEINGCVAFAHHPAKPPKASSDGMHGDQNAARGASALVTGPRFNSTLMTPSTTRAKSVGIPESERKRHVGWASSKKNYSPGDDEDRWYKRVSVELPCGEFMGVLEPVKVANIPVEHIEKALAEIIKAWQADPDKGTKGLAV